MHSLPRIATDSRATDGSWDENVELAAVSSAHSLPRKSFLVNILLHRPRSGLGSAWPDSSTKKHGGVFYPWQIVKLPAQCPPRGCVWIAPALDLSRSARGGAVSPAAPPLPPFRPFPDSGQAGEALDQSFLIKPVSLALFGCLFPSSLPSPSPSPHQPFQGLWPFPSFFTSTPQPSRVSCLALPRLASPTTPAL